MIKTNINSKFPTHLRNCISGDKSLYVADYTESTSSQRGTKLFFGTPPAGRDYIEHFSLHNNDRLQITGIVFNNRSFTRPDGNPRSQCECVVFPDVSNNESWIFFLELKYSSRDYNNVNNLNKARRQLFKTQYYYKSEGIFTAKNTCYLIASLPLQSEPFANMVLGQSYLLDMKEKHNIVIRFQNSAEIIDDKQINV